MSLSLTSLLDRDNLQRMAGEELFERGEGYFEEGRVVTLVVQDDAISARVAGTETYHVKIRKVGEGLDYACSCPIGSEGTFCKHLVAVGLTYMDQKQSQAIKSGSAEPLTMEDVKRHLLEQDKASLVDMLIGEASDNDRPGDLLSIKAARKAPKSAHMATMRKAIGNAIRIRTSIDYYNAYDYFSRVSNVVASIKELLTEGRADEVIELTEYALKTIEKNIGRVDDSDGGWSDILRQLEDMHYEACKQARPDPEALARKLFKWEHESEPEIFDEAARRYSDVLGAKGLAAYRKYAETEWGKVPALRPGQENERYEGKRFRLTHIMETLAGLSGNPDELVNVISRDLSPASAFLRIAEVYTRAGRQERALEWAEKGLQAFPGKADTRLRAFVAEEYHRRDRHDEAMSLMWEEFKDRSHLDSYQNLKTHADRVGQWPTWRVKALAYLRERIARLRKDASPEQLRWNRQANHSELVQIFLWEKDIEGAWREAQAGGCDPALWMELAKLREKDHPRDVIPVYQARIEPTLAQRHNDAYREAVVLLRKIRKLMVGIGLKDEFERYLDSVRQAHRIKRNFMKYLDEAKWA